MSGSYQDVTASHDATQRSTDHAGSTDAAQPSADATSTDAAQTSADAAQPSTDVTKTSRGGGSTDAAQTSSDAQPNRDAAQLTRDAAQPSTVAVQQRTYAAQPNKDVAVCTNDTHTSADAAANTSTGAQQIAVPVNKFTADWSRTPEVILTKIFRMLPILDRRRMTQVCYAWKAASASPLMWQHFDYGVIPPDEEVDVDRVIEQLHSNHNQYIDLIETYGEKFTRVHIVLYCQESFDVLVELSEECTRLKCAIIELYDESLKLPTDFKRSMCFLMTGNVGVQELRFRNIYFPEEKRNSPIPLGPAFAKHLRKLSFVNSFRDNNLTSLMYLINLVELTIFPQHIGVTWLNHLAKASLRTLNIVSIGGMWLFDFHNLPESTWKEITQRSQMQIHCYLMDLNSKVVCPGMPIVTLVCYEFFRLDFSRILKILIPFSETLTTFVDFSDSERSYQFKPLAADDNVITLVQKCSKLKTLVIKGCLQSSTILLLAQLNPNLTDPIIRSDMIEYSLHYPKEITLSQEVQIDIY